MAYRDLREYLAALAKTGEFRRAAKEIDAKRDAVAVIQKLAEESSPCVHFVRIKDMPEGWSLVVGAMSRGLRGTWSKLACALEIDPAESYDALLGKLVRRMASPVKPVQVASGPCKENVLEKTEAKLSKPLAPWVYGGDNVPGLSSWGVTIVREPDDGCAAWGIVPHLVRSDTELAAPVRADSALGRVFESYRAAGKPMPFAIALGGSPVCVLAAAFNCRRGDLTAVEVAGALQRSPLDLVKCETSNLLVPATAEIVLEGVVWPGRASSGGNSTGTFECSTAGGDVAIWEVMAITHRHRPIIPLATWGVPVTEIHLARSLICDIQLKQEFLRRGLPVTGVYTPPWLAGSAVAVATKVPFSEISPSIASVVRATEATRGVPYVMVFDETVDVTNAVSLFGAIGIRDRPGHGAGASPQHGHDSALILDCTWPSALSRDIAGLPPRSFDYRHSPDLPEKARTNRTDDPGRPVEGDDPASPD